MTLAAVVQSEGRAETLWVKDVAPIIRKKSLLLYSIRQYFFIKNHCRSRNII